MKVARIESNVAVEVIEIPEGFTLEESVHPDLVSLFTVVPDDVTVNSTISDDGVWTLAEPPQPAPVKPAYPVVTPATFQMLFTSSERISVRKAIAAGNEILEDWWSIVTSAQLTEVDLNLGSVQQALGYLVSLKLLTEERKEQILSGIIQ